ncbi:MAG: DUF3108 domain-containing protein [Bacteroidota bacterium]
MHRGLYCNWVVRCSLIVFGFLLHAFSAYSQDSLKSSVDTAATLGKPFGNSHFRTVENKAFGVGERLLFDISYGFLHAGEAVMTVSAIETLFTRPCYHIKFDVRSTGAFSFFYKVRDHYESFIDVQGLFPWRFEQHIQEGGYRSDFSAVFDQYRLKAVTSDKEYDIPLYVYDAVSALYFVRTLDFTGTRPGVRAHLQNFYKDQTYPLDVKYLGRQTIEVDAGTFDCIIIEPLVREGGLFKSEGRIIIWLTDDERKIPVKVSTKVLIGSIDAELKEYGGIFGAIPARRD